MNKTNRIESLDSIRGLAAASVVLLHCLLPLPFIWNMVTTGGISDLKSPELSTVSTFIFTYSPLHILWDGGAAVILFFVLSGFVLSLPFFGDRKFLYSPYMVRRFCRIYIPYISSLIFAAVLLNLFKNEQFINNLSPNFNTLWQNPVTFKTIINHVFMIGDTTSTGGHTFNGVIWTLVHEMRFSIALPLFLLIVKRNSWWVGISFAISLFFIQWSIWHSNPTSMTIQSLLETTYYSSFFVLGIIVAKYRNVLKRFYSKLTISLKISLSLLALLLYNWQWGVGFWLQLDLAIINGWMSAIGASLIIVLVLSSNKIGRFFEKNWMIWLGKISFSLYLVHSPILLSLMYLLHDLLPYWIILTSVPIISLIVASLFYKYIEVPSITIGRKLTSTIKNHSPGKLIISKEKTS